MSDKEGGGVETPNNGKEIPPFSKAERKEAEFSSENDTAREESKKLSGALTAKQIKKTAKENESKRSEVFRNHFGRVAIWALYLVFFALGLIGVIWLWHLLTPQSWRWLSDEQIHTLQAIITGGLLVGMANRHVRKRLDD